MKEGEKTNFGRLATIFHICLMDADIDPLLSLKTNFISKANNSVVNML